MLTMNKYVVEIVEHSDLHIRHTDDRVRYNKQQILWMEDTRTVYRILFTSLRFCPIILGIGTFIQAFRATSSGTVILLIDLITFYFKIRGGSWFRTGPFEYKVASLV